MAENIDSVLTIDFTGADPARASRYVQDLQDIVRQHAPQVRVSRVRDDRSAQDGGLLLEMAIAFAAHVAVVALVEAIKTFKELHPTVEMTIRNGNVTLFKGSHLESNFAETLASKIAAQPAPAAPHVEGRDGQERK